MNRLKIYILKLRNNMMMF